MPPGMENDAEVTKRFGAIFVLRSIGTSIDSAPFVVTASAFDASSVETAISSDTATFRSRDPNIKISARNVVPAKKGGTFTVRDFRSAQLREQGYETAAYIQQGSQVLVLVYSAQTEQNFRLGYQKFEGLLKSFEESAIKVKVEKGQ
jgi:hypothetical protein